MVILKIELCYDRKDECKMWLIFFENFFWKNNIFKHLHPRKTSDNLGFFPTKYFSIFGNLEGIECSIINKRLFLSSFWLNLLTYFPFLYQKQKRSFCSIYRTKTTKGLKKTSLSSIFLNRVFAILSKKSYNLGFQKWT